MPIPEFVADLRRHVGHLPLWLPGTTQVIVKDDSERPGEQLILLVRRADSGTLALVSGIVDPGEHPADTAVREAWEEARVRVEVERLVDVRVVGPVHYPNGDVTSYVDHTFLSRWVSGEPTVGDDESTEVGWYPADDLPELDLGHAEVARRALAGEMGRFLGPV
ncbi:MAG: NUDIX domain-containing protein [Mobilicoccus sp.]|nr:NUDIX domain-containing protein [Mobilicoccus sp.]